MNAGLDSLWVLTGVDDLVSFARAPGGRRRRMRRATSARWAARRWSRRMSGDEWVCGSVRLLVDWGSNPWPCCRCRRRTTSVAYCWGAWFSLHDFDLVGIGRSKVEFEPPAGRVEMHAYFVAHWHRSQILGRSSGAHMNGAVVCEGSPRSPRSGCFAPVCPSARIKEPRLGRALPLPKERPDFFWHEVPAIDFCA